MMSRETAYSFPLHASMVIDGVYFQQSCSQRTHLVPLVVHQEDLRIMLFQQNVHKREAIKHEMFNCHGICSQQWPVSLNAYDLVWDPLRALNYNIEASLMDPNAHPDIQYLESKAL